MEGLARSLKVRPDDLKAFTEVYECQGERGARNYKELLKKVRSHAEVIAHIQATRQPDEPLSDHALDRLVFCGRYSSKAGTSLEDAIKSANAGIAQALLTRTACERAVGGKLPFAVRHGTFGDEHLACRSAAFPYRPSVSASHGSAVLEARASQAVEGVVEAGALLGYAAVQGDGYVDDIATWPTFHNQGVATGLLAGAAAAELRAGRASVSLDVRAANVPAKKLYERLGFVFGPNTYPSFLDWDGGYEGEAEAKGVRAKKPPTCDLSAIEGAR